MAPFEALFFAVSAATWLFIESAARESASADKGMAGG